MFVEGCIETRERGRGRGNKKIKSGQAPSLTRYIRLTARSGTDNRIASRGSHAEIILHRKFQTIYSKILVIRRKFRPPLFCHGFHGFAWTFLFFLGALVTLIAATKYVESIPLLNGAFAVATPVIAATLSIITGLSQSFQWGSTWRDLTVHAQKIAGERDRFLATNPEERDHKRELEILNGLLLNETESFFQRILDSQMSAFISSSKNNEDKQIK